MTAITDRAREMHRVVTDSAWTYSGKVSAQAFLLRPIDRGRLSLLDKGLDDAGALAAWREAMPLRPAQQVLTHQAGAYLDVGLPLAESPSRRMPSHCSADFTGLTADEVAIKAARLARTARIGPSDKAPPPTAAPNGDIPF